MLFKTRIERTRGEALRKAANPLFIVSRAFGLLPHQYSYTFSTGWMNYSFALCAICVLCNTVIKWTIFFLFNLSNMNVLSKLLNILQTSMESLSVLTHVLTIFLNRAEYSRLLIGLRDLQELKLIHKYPYFGIPLCVLKHIVQSVVYLIINNGQVLDLEMFIFLSTLLVSLMFSLLNMVYCGFLEILRYQFMITTRELRPNHHVLLNLIKRHHKLLELTTTLNEIFSWQLLLMCTSMFMHLVSTLYVCIRALQNVRILEVLGTSGLWLWQILLLFSLAVSCEETREKADEFNNELFKLMRESNDLCSNEKLHLYVTMKQSLNFSACGFFSIGYPLVTSIIAATTTYLVILVQFSMSNTN